MRALVMAAVLGVLAGCAAVVGGDDSSSVDAVVAEAAATNVPDAARPPGRLDCSRSPRMTLELSRGTRGRCIPADLAECSGVPSYTARGAVWACDPARPARCTSADRCGADGCRCGDGPACDDQQLCVQPGDSDGGVAPAARCECL